MRSLLLVALLSRGGVCHAQMTGMAMGKPAAKPSTQLTVTGLSGKTKTFLPAEFKALPHVTVSVMNVHSGKQESYSGVAVKDLLAMVEPAKGEGPKVSSNMLLVVAGATDDFHVAITLCDTNPECRNGQVIVADMGGHGRWRADREGWRVQDDSDGRQEACAVGAEPGVTDRQGCELAH